MATAKFELACPHSDCDATLHVRPHVPAGDYPCICKGCTVRLTWAFYLQDGNKPRLALVEKETHNGN